MRGIERYRKVWILGSLPLMLGLSLKAPFGGLKMICFCTQVGYRI